MVLLDAVGPQGECCLVHEGETEIAVLSVHRSGRNCHGNSSKFSFFIRRKAD
jgi:hypothetical protein